MREKTTTEGTWSDPYGARCSDESRYGSVPGLSDEELADPEELERLAYVEDFALLQCIPAPRYASGIRPELTESGSFDWGAFDTVDFLRLRPRFNRASQKVDRLRDQLKDAIIMFAIVNDRIRTPTKYIILKYLRMGWLEFDHIENQDMRALARWYLRARRISAEIRFLSKGGRRPW